MVSFPVCPNLNYRSIKGKDSPNIYVYVSLDQRLIAGNNTKSKINRETHEMECILSVASE